MFVTVKTVEYIYSTRFIHASSKIIALLYRSVGMKTFLNVIGAQYVGPALTSGAIYVASVTDESTDILCLKGNPKSSIEQQR